MICVFQIGYNLNFNENFYAQLSNAAAALRASEITDKTAAGAKKNSLRGRFKKKTYQGAQWTPLIARSPAMSCIHLCPRFCLCFDSKKYATFSLIVTNTAIRRQQR
jgi:hypothetical protein